MKITTDNVWRSVIPGNLLTQAQHKQVSYMTNNTINKRHFVEYNNKIYHIKYIMPSLEHRFSIDKDHPFDNWDAYTPTIGGTGLTMRFSHDMTKCKVGEYNLDE